MYVLKALQLQLQLQLYLQVDSLELGNTPSRNYDISLSKFLVADKIFTNPFYEPPLLRTTPSTNHPTFEPLLLRTIYILGKGLVLEVEYGLGYMESAI
jgi:hypothetical protein